MKDYGMEKMNQKRLDADAGRLRRMIDRYNRMADELCAAGQAQQSANIREMVGHLTMAHAKGRLIDCTLDDGVITPQFGGK